MAVSSISCGRRHGDAGNEVVVVAVMLLEPYTRVHTQTTTALGGEAATVQQPEFRLLVRGSHERCLSV